MNNPKPLDLDLKKLVGEWCEPRYWLRREEPDLEEMGKFVLQRIKEACEFYLKYKNNPSLLWKENPKYRKKLKKFGITEKWVSEDCDELYDWEDYNEWLFKLAFKGVLE